MSSRHSGILPVEVHLRRRQGPRAYARRVPRRRLQRLGPRRPHARPEPRPAADRGQYCARYDQPLAGAQGGRAPGHRLRQPVLARAGADAVIRRALKATTWALAIALVALPVVAVFNGWIGAERWPLRTLR